MDQRPRTYSPSLLNIVLGNGETFRCRRGIEHTVVGIDDDRRSGRNARQLWPDGNQYRNALAPRKNRKVRGWPAVCGNDGRNASALQCRKIGRNKIVGKQNRMGRQSERRWRLAGQFAQDLSLNIPQIDGTAGKQGDRSGYQCHTLGFNGSTPCQRCALSGTHQAIGCGAYVRIFGKRTVR